MASETPATEFKKITGQEVNFDKIAENDAEYMDKFEKAINEAKKKADANSVLIGATDNPLQGILKNKKRASDKASIIKTINSFMQRFLLFEYNAFRKGMYASKLTMIDLVNKTVENFEYNCFDDFQEDKHADGQNLGFRKRTYGNQEFDC